MPVHKLKEFRAVPRRVIWQAKDGSFAIVKVDATEASGDPQPGAVLGPISNGELVIGLPYRFLGEIQISPDYGLQFKFRTFVADTPNTPNAIVAYLSRTVHGCGIGEVTARKAIDLYGPEKAVEVMRSDPARVAADFPKVDAKRLSEILKHDARFQQTKVELAGLFEGRGFSGELIDECINKFGVLAATRIKRDPWTLLVHQMPSCGFLRVDKLYLDLGLPEDRLKRQLACAWYAMRNNNEGHIWFDAKWLCGEIARSITGRVQASRAIQLGLRAGVFVTEKREGKPWIALKSDAENEAAIVEKIGVLSGRCSGPTSIKSAS